MKFMSRFMGNAPTGFTQYFALGGASSGLDRLGIYTLSGTTITKLGVPISGEMPETTLNKIQYSPNGSQLAGSSVAGARTGVAWDTSTYTRLQIAATSVATAGVSYTPDGGILAIGVGTTVQIYTVSGTTFTLANTLNPGFGNVFSVKFSPSGSMLAVASSNSPYLWIYTRSGTSFTKLSDPSGIPASIARDVSWTQAEDFLAVAESSSPFFRWFSVSGTTFTSQAAPATLPTGQAQTCAWSADGTYLAVGHSISPFLTIYKRSGSTLTKLANPGTLPTNTVFQCAWSLDGTYLGAANAFTSPYLRVYQRSGDTFTSLAVPAFPTGFSAGNGVSFYPGWQ